MIKRDWLCLELLKTRGWEARDRDDDVLDSAERFLTWSQTRNVISPAELRRLRALWASTPDRVSELVDRARELRFLLHRMFTNVAGGRLPDPPDLEALEAALDSTGRRMALAPDDDGGLSWRWAPGPASPFEDLPPAEAADAAADRILGAIAQSAADLLTSGEIERVKVCDADDCGWFFVDVSRNRSRRWCDMSGCGNRDKARRYRERHG